MFPMSMEALNIIQQPIRLVGITYDYQVPLVTRKDVTLNVRSLKSGKNGKIGENDHAPPGTPTKVELREAAEGLDRVRWIGIYMPRVNNAIKPSFNTRVEGYSGLRLQGKTIRAVSQPLTVPPSQRDAIRVGVKTEGNTARYLAGVGRLTRKTEARSSSEGLKGGLPVLVFARPTSTSRQLYRAPATMTPTISESPY